jgi:membrane protein DedA with SNARE-associated domain
LISHVIGHMRSFVAISAGLTRMPYQRFLLYETLAALFWNTMYSLVGYFIAVNIDVLETFFMRLGWVVIAVFVLIFMIWQTRKGYLQRQRQARREARYQARKQLVG